MAQTYTLIFVDSESYCIIEHAPERIAKNKSLTRRFLYANHFIPLPILSKDAQYIVFPEPIDMEFVESFYVPENDTNDIPSVAREY